jgi:hypothetical protein
MMSVTSSRSSASVSQSSRQNTQQVTQKAPSAMQSKSSPAGEAARSPEPQNQIRQNYDRDSFEAAGASGSGSPTSRASDPDAVAQKIAQDATGWNYDHSGGKTWDQTMANESNFDSSKSGVCADMAVEAAQRFEKEGVNARVVFGETDRGNHAWVEYQDAKGQWKMFDPTAASGSKNADAAITPMDNGLYNYGNAFATYDAPAEA